MHGNAHQSHLSVVPLETLSHASKFGAQPPFILGYPPQLFNLTADPDEMTNLAVLPEWREQVQALDVVLRSEVDYNEVSRVILRENHANVARWMAALPDKWEHLLSQAFKGFDDGDLAKFKQWVAAGAALLL